MRIWKAADSRPSGFLGDFTSSRPSAVRLQERARYGREFVPSNWNTLSAVESHVELAATRAADRGPTPLDSAGDVERVLDARCNATRVTFARLAAEELNRVALQVRFGHQEPLDTVPTDRTHASRRVRELPLLTDGLASGRGAHADTQHRQRARSCQWHHIIA